MALQYMCVVFCDAWDPKVHRTEAGTAVLTDVMNHSVSSETTRGAIQLSAQETPNPVPLPSFSW